MREASPRVRNANAQSAKLWRNCTLVGHELWMCSKTCLTKTEWVHSLEPIVQYFSQFYIQIQLYKHYRLSYFYQ